MRISWIPVWMVLLSGSLFAQMIPATRLTTWTGNVGVDGGIPARATEVSCVTSYSVPTDGTTAAQTTINNCLNGISSGQTAYLPAGTYTITGPVIVPSNKTLRGSSRDAVIIQAKTTAGFNNNYKGLVQIGQDVGNCTGSINIASGYVRDSQTLTFASSGAISGISINDYVIVDETNDNTIVFWTDSDGGVIYGVQGNTVPCTWCGRTDSSGTRSRGQFVKVTGKSGTDLTISPPMFWTFTSGHTPQICKPSSMTVNAGVENLTVYNHTDVTGSVYNDNIWVGAAANSWVKNVNVSRCGYMCVNLPEYNYRNEVRDNFIHDCVAQNQSGTCYGTELGFASTGNLVENNILDTLVTGPQISRGASGNVYGYNYTHRVRRTDNNNWMWSDNWAHAGHTGFNLFEGNYSDAIQMDNYWGSNSNNTFFRNRLTGKEDYAGVGNVYAVLAMGIDGYNRNMNAVGNVLWTEGWIPTGGTTEYELQGVNGDQAKAYVYKIGFTSGSFTDGADTHGSSPSTGTDPSARSTSLRHMNYDYFTHSIKHCGDTGEPACQGGDGSIVLADSLYLSSKPAFFGGLAWPPFDPSSPNAAAVVSIPAGYRYLNGEDPPSTPTTGTRSRIRR